MALMQINNITHEMSAEDEAQLAADQQAALDDMLPSYNRQIRNQLLSDSDWTQMPDSPLADEAKALWVTYRTSLRDITSTDDWPNVSFPATP